MALGLGSALEPGYGTAQAGRPRDVSNVEQRLAEREKLQAELGSVIAQLEHRLAPVLEPLPCDTANANKAPGKPPLPGLLAAALSQQNEELAGAGRQLQSIIDRLHL